MRIHPVTAGLAAVALLLLGCGEEEPSPAASPGTRSASPPGDAGLATWEVSAPEAVDPEDDSLDIGVSRVGCASGETGEIVDLDVDPGEDQVVIEATVEAFEGEAACPANDVVPTVVELDGPLGDRKLVDGSCAHERAADTTWCDTAVRWSPGTGAPGSSRTAP